MTKKTKKAQRAVNNTREIKAFSNKFTSPFFKKSTIKDIVSIKPNTAPKIIIIIINFFIGGFSK